jgi:biopolymer transport protein ExbB
VYSPALLALGIVAWVFMVASQAMVIREEMRVDVTLARQRIALSIAAFVLLVAAVVTAVVRSGGESQEVSTFEALLWLLSFACLALPPGTGRRAFAVWLAGSVSLVLVLGFYLGPFLWRRAPEYVSQGGLVMWPLAVAPIVLWYALGYRVYLLRRGNVRSVREMVRRYSDGYQRAPQGIVDTAVVRALAIKEAQPKNLRRHLDDDFTQFTGEVSRYRVLARAIVNVAPLAGLLGTVTGMIEMFDSLAEQTFYSQSGGIAGGIAEALFTTQLGLSVAVPGMIVGRILERRQHRIEHELAQIKDVLCAGDVEGACAT